MNKLFESLNNVAYTANGAISNKSTKSDLLDFFVSIGGSRDLDKKTMESNFKLASKEDPTAAIVLLFYARDILGGQGERDFFKKNLSFLSDIEPRMVEQLFPQIVEFGRWDDLYCLVGTPVESAMFAFMKRQWLQDIVADKPSLMAKWLKGSNPTNAHSRSLMKLTYLHFGLTHQQYRVGLSAMRKKLNLVETNMAAKEWDKINYSQVPGQAMRKYQKAFGRRDTERFVEYLNALENMDATQPDSLDVKVNAKTVYPHVLVSDVRNGENRIADAMWKALPAYSLDNTITVVDVSGSMEQRLSETSKITALDASLAIGLYCAEHLTGAFRNSFITFSSRPEFVLVDEKDSLSQKIDKMSGANWSMNTNLQAVFDLILEKAVYGVVPQSDMPERIVILSDMQFDQATNRNTRSNFEQIEKKFKKYGYNMPQLIFWNIAAQVGKKQFPIVQEDQALLLSGFSPVVLKYIYKNELLAPLDLVYEIVNDNRYATVKEKAKSHSIILTSR